MVQKQIWKDESNWDTTLKAIKNSIDNKQLNNSKII